MKDDLIINVKGYDKQVVKKNSSVLSLIKKMGLKDVMTVKIDDEMASLNSSFSNDCDLELIRISDKAGHRMYVAALKYMMIVAVQEIFGRDSAVYVMHSIDKGTYCEIDINRRITDEDVDKIKMRMHEYVSRDLPFEKISADKFSAVKYYKKEHEFEKAENINEMINDNVTLYKFFDYYNYFYVNMPISTGCIKLFDVIRINERGVVLCYPEREDPTTIPPYTHYDTIFRSFESYAAWLDVTDTEYVSDLNNYVSEGKISDFIRMNEIRYNNELINIVNEVNKRRDEIKLILLGGPSSSGKTTSSKKLSLYLKAYGFNPLVLSVDDYYKEREDSPRDENGNYDFECLEALDIDLFNKNIKDLIDGKTIKNPRFNFITGKKEYSDKDTSTLPPNGIIVMEGLHCINENLTKSIPRKNKYKVYISPFIPMTIDRHNHISTVDMRFLRRMVRDNLFRGYGPEHTLSTWKSVRDGEKKYLFPHMKEADTVLNTALAYELGVLKVYAAPLLYSVKPTSEYYEESRRLLNFLNSFFPIPSEFVPNDSILREFIGGSYFNKE